MFSGKEENRANVEVGLCLTIKRYPRAQRFAVSRGKALLNDPEVVSCSVHCACGIVACLLCGDFLQQMMPIPVIPHFDDPDALETKEQHPRQGHAFSAGWFGEFRCHMSKGLLMRSYGGPLGGNEISFAEDLLNGKVQIGECRTKSREVLRSLRDITFGIVVDVVRVRQLLKTLQLVLVVHVFNELSHGLLIGLD
jgi:hypothetical protein